MILPDMTVVYLYWSVLLSLLLTQGRQRRAQPATAWQPAQRNAPPNMHAAIRVGLPRLIRWPDHITVVRKGARVPVRPKPFWYDKGWRKTRNPNEYTGYYTASGRRWQGLIQLPYASRYQAYIWEPPLDEIRRYTTHGPCFSPNGADGQYEVHFHTVPVSLDQAILSIETVLDEAYRRK